MMADAAAVAAVVEEQDVEAGVVEGDGAGKGISDGAVCAVEEESGGSGGCECVCGGGGDEPAVELWEAGGVVGEVQLCEFEVERCGGGGDGA